MDNQTLDKIASEAEKFHREHAPAESSEIRIDEHGTLISFHWTPEGLVTAATPDPLADLLRNEVKQAAIRIAIRVTKLGSKIEFCVVRSGLSLCIWKSSKFVRPTSPPPR